MASIKCSKCGEGIHYHSLPQDIEYIYFPQIVWENICSTRFDKNKKVMDESGLYPKLYRSSTIESDYAGKYYKMWKCPICETLHVFAEGGRVKKIYVKDDNASNNDYMEAGVMFADYLWNDVTDQDVPNERLSSVKPSFYVKLNMNHMIVSKTSDFLNSEYYRLYLPEWMIESSLSND